MKTHLKEDGYDPARCGGDVRFLEGDHYVPLTPELTTRIEEGTLRF